MGTRLPDRWLEYTPVGKQIPKTPFVALKCPLSEAFNHSLPPKNRFGPNEIKSWLPQISLIIDLTFTTRYYSKNMLDDIGIEYEKIMVPGHVLPPIHLLKRFFRVVDNFIEKNKFNQNKLIGVHCTHGVNRTGYFICSYMISKLGFTYETAIREFNIARGHNIERVNYLDELRKYEQNPLNFSFTPGYFASKRNHEKSIGLRHPTLKRDIQSLMRVSIPTPPMYSEFRQNKQKIQFTMQSSPPICSHTSYQNTYFRRRSRNHNDPRPVSVASCDRDRGRHIPYSRQDYKKRNTYESFNNRWVNDFSNMKLK